MKSRWTWKRWRVGVVKCEQITVERATKLQLDFQVPQHVLQATLANGTTGTFVGDLHAILQRPIVIPEAPQSLPTLGATRAPSGNRPRHDAHALARARWAALARTDRGGGG